MRSHQNNGAQIARAPKYFIVPVQLQAGEPPENAVINGAREGVACYNACAMPISLETVRALARLLEETDLAELTLESTAPDVAADADNAAAGATTSQSTLSRAGEPPFRLTLQRAASKRNRRVADRETAPRKAAPRTASPDSSASGEVEIVSTSVGVFRPRAVPLQEGDEVKAGEVVGSVEALKVPSEITSEVAGRITSMRVTEGQGVEYGQVLFIIEASVT